MSFLGFILIWIVLSISCFLFFLWGKWEGENKSKKTP